MVIGTPTATSPKWLIDAHPDVLPVDPQTGRVGGFGSRRHYDFSSQTYLSDCKRIVEALAVRYGQHPCVAGWQTDNELSCHHTTLSASPVALAAFRRWCEARYDSIADLNTAWGNVFWSLEYRSFAEIELPVGAVTETNPSHRLAWRRFSSDEVVRFHDAQLQILRAHSPGRFITHNLIPMNETGVDNHAVAAGLDFASYDNYPLGRTDLLMADEPPEVFTRYMRTGHPDFGVFFFDQTRGLAPGDFWIMEQQPGPVNWPGTIRAPPPAWFGSGRSKPSPRGPAWSAISAGARPASPRSRCMPGSCAPTARPARPGRRSKRSWPIWPRSILRPSARAGARGPDGRYRSPVAGRYRAPGGQL